MKPLDDFLNYFKRDFHAARTNRSPFWRTSGQPYDGVSSRVGGFAGRVASDFVGDETRSNYWKWNHPLGVASSVGNNVLKVPGIPVGYEAIGGALLSLGVLPVASGNFDLSNLGDFGRPKGYSALFPNPLDKTKTTNPFGEFVGRYIVGRKGDLLPYQELVKELPNITPDQYARAKNSSSFMAKDFFGLQNNIGNAIALGAGVGAAIGGWRRRPEIFLDEGEISFKPRVAQSMENATIYDSDPSSKNVVSKAPVGRYWIPIPERVEFGRPQDIAQGALTGAALGGGIGATIPALTQLGVIRSQENLNGEGSVSLLGYEVPFSAMGITALSAAGLGWFARNKYRPDDYRNGLGDLIETYTNNNPRANTRMREHNEDVYYNRASGKWEYLG